MDSSDNGQVLNFCHSENTVDQWGIENSRVAEPLSYFLFEDTQLQYGDVRAAQKAFRSIDSTNSDSSNESLYSPIPDIWAPCSSLQSLPENYQFDYCGSRDAFYDPVWGQTISSGTGLLAGGNSGFKKSPSSVKSEGEETSMHPRQCAVCDKAFESLQLLDQHTRNASHKGWECPEEGCNKAYARRDTFLRHRSTHKDNRHPCAICYRDQKHKSFKRRDHLKEHIRNCHLKGADASGSSDRTHDSAQDNSGSCCGVGSELPSFNNLVHELTADAVSENSMATDSVKDEPSTPEQQEAMRSIVKSLGTVLGDRHHKLIGSLETEVNTLTGKKMEMVAESMAGIALAKTLVDSRVCQCPKP